MSTQSDLIAYADQVRDFINNEIPTTAQWNVNPTVQDSSLRRIGTAFAAVEADITTLDSRLDAITTPTGGLIPASEWIPDPAAPVFIDASNFYLVGDSTTNYRQGARVRVTLSGPTLVIGIVSTVVYSGASNRTTITFSTTILNSSLSKVEYSIVRESRPVIQTADLADLAVTTAKLGNTQVTLAKMATNAVDNPVLAGFAVTREKIAVGNVVNVKDQNWFSNSFSTISVDAQRVRAWRTLNTRGGVVIIIASFGGWIWGTATGSAAISTITVWGTLQVHTQLPSTGQAPPTTGFTTIRSQAAVATVPGGLPAGAMFQFPFHIDLSGIDQRAAGLYHYTISSDYSQSGNAGGNGCSINGHGVAAVELA